MYVEKIIDKESKKEIYRNEDFKNIIQQEIDSAKKYMDLDFRLSLSLYAKKLLKYLGKPIIYDNKRLVLRSVQMGTRFGKKVVYASGTDGVIGRTCGPLKSGAIKIDKVAYKELDEYGKQKLHNYGDVEIYL